MNMQKLLSKLMTLEDPEVKESTNMRVCVRCTHTQKTLAESNGADYENLCENCGALTRRVNTHIKEDSSDTDNERIKYEKEMEDKSIIADDVSGDTVRVESISIYDTVMVINKESDAFGKCAIVESILGPMCCVVIDDKQRQFSLNSVRLVSETKHKQFVESLAKKYKAMKISEDKLKEYEYLPVYDKGLAKAISESSLPFVVTRSSGKIPYIAVPSKLLYEVHSAHTMFDNYEQDEYEEYYEDDLLDGGEEDMFAEPSPEDIVIADTGMGSTVKVYYIEGDMIGKFSDYEQGLAAVRQKTAKDNFFPSVWHINDHGNTQNISQEVYEQGEIGSVEEEPVEESIDEDDSEENLSMGDESLDKGQYEEKLVGGIADGTSPEDYDPEQLETGTRVEMEHTDDPEIAREIAMDNLKEDPDYYVNGHAREYGSLDDSSKDTVETSDTYKATPSVVEAVEEKPLETLTDDNQEESEEKPDDLYEYDCLMLNIPENIAARVRSFAEDIPDDILYVGEGTEEDAAKFGREMQTHLTILYGLENTNVDELSSIVDKYNDISGTLGEVSVFEGDDYDVIYIPVVSDAVNALNKELVDGVGAPGNDHPDYIPHITVAYVKPGEGANYIGDDRFADEQFESRDFVFSPAEGEDFKLNGQSSMEQDDTLFIEEQKEVSYTVKASSIATKEEADRIAASTPNSKVTTDSEDPELFMVVVEEPSV
jgi:2'-5' RNA ligase